MSIYLPSLRSIKEIIDNRSIKKILVISGYNSFYKSGAKSLFSKLLTNKETKIVLKKNSYPELKELKKIILNINQFNPNLIIAIGGGCVLDYAKTANVLNKFEDIRESIEKPDKKLKKFCKILAIPTTAGSGAEVTANSVIYINKTKYSVEGEKLKPDFYSIIPELFLSSSKKFDASSGFDAISQAIESMFSQKSDKISLRYSKKALKYLLGNYVNFVNSKNNINTFKMATGANLSGKAISISKTTAPHALSYPFTAHFQVPHGHAVSLTLNKFLMFNYDKMNNSDCNYNLKARFNELFKITNTRNMNELNKMIINLKKRAGLEQRFSKLNINLSRDFNKIISGVNLLRLSNNPVKINKEDIKFILNNY